MRTPLFTRIFGDRPKVVIGMIHVRALPGTPRHEGGFAPILDQALADASLALVPHLEVDELGEPRFVFPAAAEQVLSSSAALSQQSETLRGHVAAFLATVRAA